MKKAFTMIELIFVIVILGILAAVALPKFIGVAEQAREGNLKSFTGTLNRTIGPSLWSKAISNDGTGKIANLSSDDLNLSKYTEVPQEVNEINLSRCNTDGTGVAINIDKNKMGGDYDYLITCKDGTPSEAPKFTLYKISRTNDQNDTTLPSGAIKVQ
jgi:prepilin-type N-terminal cleavage/methylation domain-containing protein